MSDKLEIHIKAETVEVPDGEELRIEIQAHGALTPAVMSVAIPQIEEKFAMVIQNMEKELLLRSVKELFRQMPPELAKILKGKMDNCEVEGFVFGDGDDLKKAVTQILDCDGDCKNCKKQPTATTKPKRKTEISEVKVETRDPDPEKMEKFKKEFR